MQELIKKIEQWAIDRELDKKGTVEGQSIKTAEEIAELIKGISKDNIDLIKDSIGDVFVTLVIGNMLDKKFDIEELIKYAKDLIVGDEIEWEKDILVARLGSSISDIAEYKYEDTDIEFTLAVIIYASKFYNLDFKDCVESAYNEIAGREGEMIDGVFVKNIKMNSPKEELFNIAVEYARTPIEEREDNKTLDSIIHRLEAIRTNSEDAISRGETMSWIDVMSWISKELEKNRDLKNELEDIIKELGEYKEILNGLN